MFLWRVVSLDLYNKWIPLDGWKIRQEEWDISKSNFQKNFGELVERKIVEGIVGLRTLFGIKLNSVLEANAVDDLRGKGEGRL